MLISGSMLSMGPPSILKTIFPGAALLFTFIFTDPIVFCIFCMPSIMDPRSMPPGIVSRISLGSCICPVGMAGIDPIVAIMPSMFQRFGCDAIAKTAGCGAPISMPSSSV